VFNVYLLYAQLHSHLLSLLRCYQPTISQLFEIVEVQNHTLCSTKHHYNYSDCFIINLYFLDHHIHNFVNISSVHWHFVNQLCSNFIYIFFPSIVTCQTHGSSFDCRAEYRIICSSSSDRKIWFTFLCDARKLCIPTTTIRRIAGMHCLDKTDSIAVATIELVISVKQTCQFRRDESVIYCIHIFTKAGPEPKRVIGRYRLFGIALFIPSVSRQFSLCAMEKKSRPKAEFRINN
jgi:hypothetical protein